MRVVILVGNCGLYLGDFGVRIEDTVVVREKGPAVLTDHPRRLVQ
jgi:Xaa-Pro aminopeptidase